VFDGPNATAAEQHDDAVTADDAHVSGSNQQFGYVLKLWLFWIIVIMIIV
jgi:hypothetical protein